VPVFFLPSYEKKLILLEKATEENIGSFKLNSKSILQ